MIDSFNDKFSHNTSGYNSIHKQPLTSINGFSGIYTTLSFH